MPRFLLLAVLLTAPALAADPPKKAADPTTFEAKFADGSVVQLSVLEPTVAVATKYGKLTIPLADVRRIEFGFRFPEGMQAKVDAVAADLGSAEFKAREQASKDLLTFGEFALPAVKLAMKSDSPEVSRRGQDALRKLEETLPKELLELRDYDMIQTADGPIRGTIETAAFKAKSRYFGDTALKLADLRHLRPMGRGAEAFTVEAAKHGKPGWAAWLDTGVEVATDATLEVTASGKVDLVPSEPDTVAGGPAGVGQYVTGPNGERPTAVRQLGGGPGGGFGGPAGAPGGLGGGGGAMVVRNGFKSGALYGRIGERGTPFLIGEAYKGKPAEKGKLYLIIGPTERSTEAGTGEFAVRVKAGG